MKECDGLRICVNRLKPVDRDQSERRENKVPVETEVREESRYVKIRMRREDEEQLPCHSGGSLSFSLEIHWKMLLGSCSCNGADPKLSLSLFSYSPHPTLCLRLFYLCLVTS